ncbi:MAG TPA: hypothetical protein ENI17_09705 [Pseudomonas xinjiangensis]|uniref:Uncharacterized protein n=2 Tax=root TaxID=1 RepID=A0A7V1FTC8_9GAMM|nr:hypothetical protein [Halopseudomonas xinjiangensis]HEC47890.1 hypothetical protein [Halopseudomonas xinjiangensis]
MTVSATSHPYSKRNTASLGGDGRNLRQQKLISATAFVLSLICIVFALPMMLAGIASDHTERALQSWEQADSPPSKTYWELSRMRAERAVSQFPVVSGEYSDRLGRVLSWGPLVERPDADSKQEIELALHAFRESAAARPSWPWTWLRIAYAKRGLQQVDEEFALALQRASELGTGRVELNRGLASLGFMSWESLDREQRTLTLAAAGRAAAHSSDEAARIFGLAHASGLNNALCWSLSNAIKSQQQICKEEGSP